MDLINELLDALKKHRLLKGRIKMILINDNLTDAEQIVINHYRCDFGKWLHNSDTVAEFKKSGCFSYYKEIDLLHQKMHEETIELLKHAKRGEKAKVLEFFSPDGKMNKIFKEFISSIKRVAQTLAA
jgi:hypothetical protein